VERSGGGALMDLGCHGIAFCYWFLDRPAIKSIYAQVDTLVHGKKGKGDDEAICIIEFENGARGLVEDSWNRLGGMTDRSEIYGDGGVTYADLHMGNALPTYSERGFGYAVEKAPSTQGWSYPVFEEHWNYGIPQEMRHFARCVRGKEALQATGEDGRVVMQALYAAYASAGMGQKVQLPYQPTTSKPIDEWLGRLAK
jgi:predicted dehydrogenase